MEDIKSTNGFIIAFVGQDGAGKTTISNIMLEKLKKSNNATSMYLGSGENYSSIIKTIYKKLEKRNSDSSFTDIFGMLFYMQVARNCAKKAQLSKKIAEKGSIVFWDRCPQIQYKGINDGPKIESKFGESNYFITKLIYPYCKKREMSYLVNAVKVHPDIVVKLHLPVEESMRRKPDNDINKIRKKHMIVENLQFPQSKVIDIDATQNLGEEISQIYTQIGEYSLKNKENNVRKRDFIKQIKDINVTQAIESQNDRSNMLEEDKR